jgi:hypothetical protein
MFQWSSSSIAPETVHSLVFIHESGQTFVEYAGGISAYVWRTTTWPAGDYQVYLRATYMDFDNRGMDSPFYAGQMRYATSATYLYTIENVGPEIDLGTAKLIVLGSGTSGNVKYRFTVDITDTSEIYSVWLYYSVNNGQTFTLASMKYDTVNQLWKGEFEAKATNSMVIRIQAEDMYGFRSTSNAVVLRIAGATVTTTVTKSPGFELPMFLLALAGLSAFFLRRRE